MNLLGMKKWTGIIGCYIILLTTILQSCKKENEEELPQLLTEPPGQIARTSAWFGGTILDDGSDSIMVKGFCWSLEPEPTLADQSAPHYFSYEGHMENHIGGLIPGTIYYARAYATNAAGTGYGNQVSFTTKPAKAMTLFNTELSYDSVQDIDGNRYKTISIGSQVWMAENLKTTRYNDGASIPLITVDPSNDALLSPGYSWYENNETLFKDIYGAYYNWFAIKTQKVCPSGWHLPSDEEWKVMEMFLGMTREEADAIGYRGTTEGEKLKESGNYNWTQESLQGSNLSGFTALPGGLSSQGTFGSEGYWGGWWSATEVNPDPYSWAWCHWVFWDGSWTALSEITKSDFLNVRCIKD